MSSLPLWCGGASPLCVLLPIAALGGVLFSFLALGCSFLSCFNNGQGKEERRREEVKVVVEREGVSEEVDDAGYK